LITLKTSIGLLLLSVAAEVKLEKDNACLTAPAAAISGVIVVCVCV